MITNNYSTTPGWHGQSPSASPNKLKYTFDPNRCIIFDCEVFPGPRWCVGFLFPGRGKYLCIDGDRARLAEILDKIHKADRTLVGYNSAGYDLPVLRAVLAGLDPYPVSRTLINYEGYGLPPELRDRAARWPTIEVDHIDLCARTKNHGHFPGLKMLAAHLGCKHLAELPYPPDRVLTDEEWTEVLQYNKKDLLDTRLALEHFAPELEAIVGDSSLISTTVLTQASVPLMVNCVFWCSRAGRGEIPENDSLSILLGPGFLGSSS